jgi:FkbM family methyltransferase
LFELAFTTPPLTREYPCILRACIYSQFVHFQKGQSRFVDDILLHKRDGVFVEGGACDGESLSNSLYFELFNNWTGVLIEPNPVYFNQLLQKHRKTYKINACISPSDKPELLNFTNAKLYGGLVGFVDSTRRNLNVQYENTIPTQCFPLYSILKAAGFSHVNYCALDIEGSELQVIQSFPWPSHDIDIEVLGVEVDPVDEGKDIIDVLEGHSYRKVPAPFELDIIMIKNVLL